MMEFITPEFIEKLFDAGIPAMGMLWLLGMTVVQYRRIGLQKAETQSQAEIKRVEIQSNSDAELTTTKTKLAEAEAKLIEAQTQAETMKQLGELAGTVSGITDTLKDWEQQRIETNNVQADSLRQISSAFVQAMNDFRGELTGKVDQSIVNTSTIMGTISDIQSDFKIAKDSVITIETELRQRMSNLESTVTEQVGAIRDSVAELTAQLQMRNNSTELHVSTLVQLSEILGQIAAILDAIKDKTLADETQEIEQVEKEKDKPNVQPMGQSDGLGAASRNSSHSDGDYSGDSSQTVPPHATGPDTKRGDDQSKSAL
jgi:hypothetical protein